MNSTSIVLLSKLDLSRKLAELSDKSTFGFANQDKLNRDWNRKIFQFLIQYCLDNCTTYTSKQIEELTGILNFYIFK